MRAQSSNHLFKYPPQSTHLYASSNFPVFQKQVIIHAIPALHEIHHSASQSSFSQTGAQSIFSLYMKAPLFPSSFSSLFMDLLSCFSQNTHIPQPTSKCIGFSHQEKNIEHCGVISPAFCWTCWHARWCLTE